MPLISLLSSRHRRKISVLAFWSLTVLMILPVWLIDPLPLVDLPSHIARADILDRYSETPFLQSVYYMVVEPIPNVGIDLLMMAMLKVLPVALASKLLVSVIILLYVVGVRRIFEIFQPESWWLLWVAPLLAYHAMFIYGFLNYDLGIGLFFLTFAYWFIRREKLKFGEGIIFTLLAAACYLSHLSSYALLLVGVATITAYDLYHRKESRKRILMAAVPVLLPLVMLFWFFQGTGSNRGMVYGSLKGKITSFLVMVTSYRVTFDLVLIIVLLLLALVGFLIAREKKMHPEALLLALAFGAAYVLCPGGLVTASMADARIVPAFFVFLLAAISFKLPSGSYKLLLPLALGLLGLRVLLVVIDWSSISARMEKDLELSRIIPEHARVRALYYDDVVVLNKRERAFRHLPSYLMLEKDMVVTNYFGQAGMQPVVFREQPADVPLHRDMQLDQRSLDSLITGFDHIWAYKLTPEHTSALGSRYSLISSNEELSIYRVK
ncbi:MAG TPA: hypothetical protein VFH43_02705 [Candidatus Kapabacteria bacterium]|nr:hypothetical protein [Candidatus Kapabacteria bacterium]